MLENSFYGSLEIFTKTLKRQMSKELPRVYFTSY